MILLIALTLRVPPLKLSVIILNVRAISRNPQYANQQKTKIGGKKIECKLPIQQNIGN
jgi:hypothetical protein